MGKLKNIKMNYVKIDVNKVFNISFHIIPTSKAKCLTLLWYRGPGELENGQLFVFFFQKWYVESISCCSLVIFFHFLPGGPLSKTNYKW